jgi:N-acetyl-anhydromuramyl-L-alanine amidase AmpD
MAARGGQGAPSERASGAVSRKITHVVVHHAANPKATLESITRTHVKEKGWRAIGYNVVIERGVRRAGRNPRMHGAHTPEGTRNINAISLGVCIADDCNKRLRPEDWSALVGQCADWCAHYGLPASAVIGHRETPQHGGAPTRKACPGKLVSMEALRAEVAARLAQSERIA